MSTFMEDLKGKLFKAKEEAGKIAKIAIDKTTNAVDITKLNIAKNEAEGKITKLYAKIGEIVYGKYQEGEEFDGVIGETLIEIDKFKEDLNELTAQIASLKNTAPCPNCGQQNDKANEYCSKCGAKISESEEPSEETLEEDQVVEAVSEEE